MCGTETQPCWCCRAQISQGSRVDNPERVASTSPRLLYSATLGNVGENGSYPERVAAGRVSRSIIRDATPLGLGSLTTDSQGT
jgi:hypothetical protein